MPSNDSYPAKDTQRPFEDCPKCEALYEVLRQVAFADELPHKIRMAYAAYRKVAPGCNHLQAVKP